MLTQTDQPTDNAPVFIPECPKQERPEGVSGVADLEPVEIWGVPLASVDYGRTLDLVDKLVAGRGSHPLESTSPSRHTE